MINKTLFCLCFLSTSALIQAQDSKPLKRNISSQMPSISIKPSSARNEQLSLLLADRKRENEIRANGGELKEDEIPKEICFKKKSIKVGRQTIAGRVTLTEGYPEDYVTFFTFDGMKVNSNERIRVELDNVLREKLKDVASIPVFMTGNYVTQTISSTNSTTSYPSLEYVYFYEIAEVDKVCKEAKAKGFSPEECEQFKKHFKLDNQTKD